MYKNVVATLQTIERVRRAEHGTDGVPPRPALGALQKIIAFGPLPIAPVHAAAADTVS